MLEVDLSGQHVSRETIDKLLHFQDLVRKWSPRINLVSKQDLQHLWERHVRDSAQLAAFCDTPQKWLDLGSGAGFPGIVVAIMIRDRSDVAPVTLVESDRRKCVFLKSAARELNIDVDVQARRIEDLEQLAPTTLSARALAPLARLLGYARFQLAEEGVALFPKGKGWQKEVQQAKEKWSFQYDVLQSITDQDAAVLKIRNIQRIQGHGR